MHPSRYTAGQHRCPLSHRQVCSVSLGGFTPQMSTSLPVESCSSGAEANPLTLPSLQAHVRRLHSFCSDFTPPLSFLFLPLPPPSSTGLLDYYLGHELGRRLQAPQSRLNQHGRAPSWRYQDKQGNSSGRRPTGNTAALSWTRLLHAECTCGHLLTLSEPVVRKPRTIQSGGCSGGCSSLQ